MSVFQESPNYYFRCCLDGHNSSSVRTLCNYMKNNSHEHDFVALAVFIIMTNEYNNCNKISTMINIWGNQLYFKRKYILRWNDDQLQILRFRVIITIFQFKLSNFSFIWLIRVNLCLFLNFSILSLSFSRIDSLFFGSSFNLFFLFNILNDFHGSQSFCLLLKHFYLDSERQQ